MEIKNIEEIKLFLGKEFEGWVFDFREENTLRAYREDRPVETSYTMRDFIGDERDVKSVTRMIEWVNNKYPNKIYELSAEHFKKEGFSVEERENKLLGKKPINLQSFEDGQWCDFMLYFYYRKKFKSLTLVRYNIHDPDKKLSFEDMDKVISTNLYRGRVRSKEHLQELLTDILWMS